MQLLEPIERQAPLSGTDVQKTDANGNHNGAMAPGLGSSTLIVPPTEHGKLQRFVPKIDLPEEIDVENQISRDRE